MRLRNRTVESKVITPKHKLPKNIKILLKRTEESAENIPKLKTTPKTTPKTKYAPNTLGNTPNLNNTEYLVNLESSQISGCNTIELLEESLNLNLTFAFTPKLTVKRKQTETPKTKQTIKPKF